MLRDRPELGPSDDEGLPLKNTRDEYANRRIPLDKDTVDVIRGYIRYERKEHDEPDKYGRVGLVTTERSPRISKQCIGTRIHALTSPVEYDGECDCPGCREFFAEEGSYPCPSDRRSVCDRTRSPHQCRHGAITHMLNQGHDHDTVAHIVGTSPQTIRNVYDRGDEWDRLSRTAQKWKR